jgi:hypothetical protein
MRPKRTPAKTALLRLLAIVKHGDAPNYANLPQVDLASRWYVRLASEVESACDELGITEDMIYRENPEGSAIP